MVEGYASIRLEGQTVEKDVIQPNQSRFVKNQNQSKK
jgi:hypothetical protein